MREFLGSNSLVNTLAMLQSDTSHLVIIPEGEDDFDILETHVAADQVTLVFPAGGKAHLMEVARRVDQLELDRVIFLLDRDYDHIVNQTLELQTPNCVILSESHDFIMDLVEVSTPTLCSLLEAHARTSRRAARKNGLYTDRYAFSNRMIESARSLASALSAFRCVSASRGLNLDFADFPFGALSSLDDPGPEMALLLARKSKDAPHPEVLLAHIRTEVPSREVLTSAVGDHDFFQALARSLREVGIKGISGHLLMTEFMGAIHCSALGESATGMKLTEWAEKRGRSIFACPACSYSRESPEKRSAHQPVVSPGVYYE